MTVTTDRSPFFGCAECADLRDGLAKVANDVAQTKRSRRIGARA